MPSFTRDSPAPHSVASVRSSNDNEPPKIFSVSLSNLKKHAEFADHLFKPSPFYTRWVHGYNHKVGVINLNNDGSTTVFYAASNYGILYNWTTHTMKILQGHRHMVTCIASDSVGKWIVTGDTGSENIIIIWDQKDLFPYRTIFNPHRNAKLAKLTLSADAKFLLTLGYSKDAAQLNWWIWSLGSDVPSASLEVPQISKDSILALEFNPTNSHQFVLISKFFIWIGVTEKIFVMERGVSKETNDYAIKLRTPEKKPNPETGKMTCFCFVASTSQVVVGTHRGMVLLYGYAMEYKRDVDSSNCENFKFIKALKISKHRINVIKYVDDVVVTGNGNGEIHFYDDQMKLLYWVHGFTVESVRGLSFNIQPRSYMLLDPRCKKQCQCWESVVAETDPETGLICTKLMKKKVPTDATKGMLPFLVRDFIVCCYNTGVSFVDFVPEKKQTIMNYKVSPALALTVHPEKKLICIGYMNGYVELLNFLHHKVQARLDLREHFKVVIPPKDDSIHGDYNITIPCLSVTCLSYSPSGLHLACGLNTGQLVFLDPTTIDIKSTFKDTKHAVKEIVYSPDSLTLAFSDQGKTVCVYKYECEKLIWNFIGKHRAHYKEINSLLFVPAKNPSGDFKLLSFGADRIMVEYNIGESSDEYLEILSLDRIDQTAVPLEAIVWPEPKNLDPEEYHTHMPIILVANDEHKYKIVNYETTMALATYLGPRFEHPVRKMMLATRKDEEGNSLQYLLFATKIIIGMQKLPLDGNPWKHVGMLGHPNQIITMCFREDSGFLFTIGAKDNCLTQWKGNSRAVEKTYVMGGIDLDPYYCLIENGRPGWLFQEVRDLFYYIQILCQGTFSPAMRRVKDYIPIDSLPDLMRALGFFPTEYEVENLLVEAKYQVYKREPRPEIDFEEFVKLYLNHRPAFLDTSKKIRNAFKSFSEFSKKGGEFIRRNDFVDTLCNYGECFSRELAWYLLSILTGQSFEDRAIASAGDFSFLPNKIKLSDLTSTILGIPDVDLISEQHSNGPSMSTGDESSEESDQGSFFDKIFNA